jgi:hypothetical protein
MLVSEGYYQVLIILPCWVIGDEGIFVLYRYNCKAWVISGVDLMDKQSMSFGILQNQNSRRVNCADSEIRP